jgi:ribosomal protein L37AE/L43A
MTGGDVTAGTMTGGDMTEQAPASVEDGPAERQVPFYCPYCGEEELRPAGSKAGEWACRACARSFQLRFTGVIS